jgi:hypothetical protein
MSKMFQSLPLIAAVGALLMSGTTTVRADDGPNYFGRWTVKDEKPVFSKNGLLYKTVDVAPCGADFCGVSVAENGACGPTMFRFLSTSATKTELNGHGKWGDIKKNVVIEYWTESETPVILIGLGDKDYSPESRESSMPTYEAQYKREGDALCKVDGGKTS